jgi:hypothetical protein
VHRRLNGLAALAIVVAAALAAFAFYTFGARDGEGQSQRPTSPKKTTTTTTSSTVFGIDTRPKRSGPNYAGIRQGEALRRARQVVITSRKYGGDEPLFYRNTGDAAITQRTRIGGHSVWLVRFEDGQVQRVMCVAVRRRPSSLIAAREVPCRRK